MDIIRIGTRSSRLALIQTQYVIDAIHVINPTVQCKIIPMESLGDRNVEKPLISFERNGVFCDELESAILQGTIDIAVHSSKDMSLEPTEGLGILGALRREDPRDILITNRNSDNKQHRIGTCSIRREMQIKKYIPNCHCLSLRGDVETRLNKLSSGMYDGIILAAAGVIRLGLQEDTRFHYQYYEVNQFVPATGQGIIAIEGIHESRWKKLIEMITDPIAYGELMIERRLYTLLDNKENSSSSVHVKLGRLNGYKNDNQQRYNLAVWLLLEEDNELSVKHFHGEITETIAKVERYLETKER